MIKLSVFSYSILFFMMVSSIYSQQSLITCSLEVRQKCPSKCCNRIGKCPDQYQNNSDLTYSKCYLLDSQTNFNLNIKRMEPEIRVKGTLTKQQIKMKKLNVQILLIMSFVLYGLSFLFFCFSLTIYLFKRKLHFQHKKLMEEKTRLENKIKNTIRSDRTLFTPTN